MRLTHARRRAECAMRYAPTHTNRTSLQNSYTCVPSSVVDPPHILTHGRRTQWTHPHTRAHTHVRGSRGTPVRTHTLSLCGRTSTPSPQTPRARHDHTTPTAHRPHTQHQSERKESETRSWKTALVDGAVSCTQGGRVPLPVEGAQVWWLEMRLSVKAEETRASEPARSGWVRQVALYQLSEASLRGNE